jgi:hypothetical protein
MRKITTGIDSELLDVIKNSNIIYVSDFYGIRILVLNNGTNSNYFQLNLNCSDRLYDLCLKNNINIIARENRDNKNTYMFYRILNSKYSEYINFNDEKVLKNYIREQKIKSII